jgi:uncharacterized protein
VIFVDSNIPMYIVGAEHPCKQQALALLDEAVRNRRRLVTDAEVLQEILHRYAAIRQLEAVNPALAVLEAVIDEVFPVEGRDVLAARDILLAAKSLSARDAVHAAIMRRHRVADLMSFDAGFDDIPGLRRLGGYP